MKHYISNESCEKEIKEILCVPEKKKCVSTFRNKYRRKKRYINEFLKWLWMKGKFNKSNLDFKRICR